MTTAQKTVVSGRMRRELGLELIQIAGSTDCV